MRTFLAAVGVFTLAVVCWTLSGRADEKEKTVKDDTDITAAAKELNSDKFLPPPTNFRPGHVAVRELDPKAIVADKEGFRIQLPSKAPIPTPTVSQGRLYASGGFHSKEFYCFDAETGKLNWAVDLDDDGPTSAVVEDDVVVFNTESCTIFALDAKTGKHLWSYFLGDPLTSTPTIANGKVFTSYPANGGGGVNGAEGRRWKRDEEGRPVAPRRQAAVGCDPGQEAGGGGQAAARRVACPRLLRAEDRQDSLAALDRQRRHVRSGRQRLGSLLHLVRRHPLQVRPGQRRHRQRPEDASDVRPGRGRQRRLPHQAGRQARHGRQGRAGFREHRRHRSSGRRRQRHQPKFEENKRDAAYLDSKVQAQSELKKQSKDLDAGNGFGGGVAPAAANPDAPNANIGQANVSSLQAFQGSRILNFADRNYNCMGDEILCSDPSSGKKVWSAKLTGDLKKEGGHLAAPPAAAGGRIFLSTLEGNVLQMDPAKGSIEKTYKIGSPLRSQPAIVDGRLYLGTQDGRIVCVDTGNRAFTGWSTWGAKSGHTNVADEKK